MSFDRNLEWPRLAKYDDAQPQFALFQNWGENIQVVRCGNPPQYVAEIERGQLHNFCLIFGLAVPSELCDHASARNHADCDTSHSAEIDHCWSCSRCGFGT
jgi:hypothetical protein